MKDHRLIATSRTAKYLLLFETEKEFMEAALPSQYTTGIRKLANDLWNGRIGSGTFEVLLASHVQAGIIRAWNQGAKQVGIKPNELSSSLSSALISHSSGCCLVSV